MADTTIDWGDGSPVEDGPEKGTVSHTYEDDGPQTATVCDAENPDACTEVEFEIPFPVEGDDPSVTAEADEEDETGRTVSIVLAGFPEDSDVTVDWGDDTDAETVSAGTTTATHAYGDEVEGEQTITATAKDDDTKTAQATFTPEPVPEPDPEPSITATADESDETGRTVAIELSDFPEDAAVSVEWGDDTEAEELSAGTTTGTHAYASGVEGEQTITATSADDESATATATFTPEPEPEPDPEPSVTATADSDDETGRTASLALEGFPEDSGVSVDWGDGTDAEEIEAGETTASHQYAEDVTEEQTITATSADDESATATATFTPAGGASLRSTRRKRK